MIKEGTELKLEELIDRLLKRLSCLILWKRRKQDREEEENHLSDKARLNLNSASFAGIVLPRSL